MPANASVNVLGSSLACTISTVSVHDVAHYKEIIAARLGVDNSTVDEWIRTKGFPEEVLRLAAHLASQS